jgi:O-antigen ligase
MAGMSMGIVLVALGVALGLGLSRAFRKRFFEQAQASFRSGSVRAFAFLTLALVAALLASLVMLKVAPHREVGASAPEFFLRDIGKLLYLTFPFLWVTLLQMMGEQRKKQVLGIWCFFAGLMGIFGVIQFFTGFPRPQVIPTSPQFFHVTLLFGHHLSTASIMIFPGFAALALAQAEAPRIAAPTGWFRFLRFRGFWLFSGTSALFAVLLSFSRMAWLALPMGLLVFTLRHFKFGRPRLRTLGLMALVLLSVSTVIWKTPTLQERIRNPMGISTRLALWKWNVELFLERPVFGVGWRRSEVFTHALVQEKLPDPRLRKDIFVGHAHNNWIEMLSGTGLVGLVMWSLYSLFPVWRAFRYRRLQTFWSSLSWGLACAWIVFLLNGLTQVNFWEGKVMHQWALSLGFLLMTLVEIEEHKMT